jgi:hypothetical protein
MNYLFCLCSCEPNRDLYFLLHGRCVLSLTNISISDVFTTYIRVFVYLKNGGISVAVNVAKSYSVAYNAFSL